MIGKSGVTYKLIYSASYVGVNLKQEELGTRPVTDQSHSTSSSIPQHLLSDKDEAMTSPSYIDHFIWLKQTTYCIFNLRYLIVYDME